jgi:hypothetical protein
MAQRDSSDFIKSIHLQEAVGDRLAVDWVTATGASGTTVAASVSDLTAGLDVGAASAAAAPIDTRAIRDALESLGTTVDPGVFAALSSEVRRAASTDFGLLAGMAISASALGVETVAAATSAIATPVLQAALAGLSDQIAEANRLLAFQLDAMGDLIGAETTGFWRAMPDNWRNVDDIPLGVIEFAKSTGIRSCGFLGRRS